jgi:hypothetical protein
MSATVCPRRKAVTLIRPRRSGVTSMVSRTVKRLASDSREVGVSSLRTQDRRRWDGRRRRVWQCGRSSHEPLDLGGERDDLAGGGSVVVDLADQSAATCGVGEVDALADCRSEQGWVVVDEQLCCLVGDDRSRAAAVQNEAGDQLRAEDARSAMSLSISPDAQPFEDQMSVLPSCRCDGRMAIAVTQGALRLYNGTGGNMTEVIAYAGLDAHSASISVAVAWPGQDKPEYLGRIPTNPAAVDKLIGRIATAYSAIRLDAYPSARMRRIHRSWAAKGAWTLLIHRMEIWAFPLERIRRILC